MFILFFFLLLNVTDAAIPLTCKGLFIGIFLYCIVEWNENVVFYFVCLKECIVNCFKL